jgi:hypothetical protein
MDGVAPPKLAWIISINLALLSELFGFGNVSLGSWLYFGIGWLE